MWVPNGSQLYDQVSATRQATGTKGTITYNNSKARVMENKYLVAYQLTDEVRTPVGQQMSSPHSPKPALRPKQPAAQWVQGFLSGRKAASSVDYMPPPPPTNR